MCLGIGYMTSCKSTYNQHKLCYNRVKNYYQTYMTYNQLRFHLNVFTKDTFRYNIPNPLTFSKQISRHFYSNVSNSLFIIRILFAFSFFAGFKTTTDCYIGITGYIRRENCDRMLWRWLCERFIHQFLCYTKRNCTGKYKSTYATVKYKATIW